ncbi:MAG: bifunctional GTP diphosphokinase/guanosine-3',5'-bis pyrophosphate 3'-pyrophosphohydrolase [gamma proteobacterium symbiont of Bathyaustriella thionipta]|nr:bifunctional GTP diphosphokinase/guanosine-3',5'-bis pyrophosphate 3'-pyrophosphohydrolase [gamma proteobacterium symbiont of Bathyaustriella thionipta]MCU7949973.1 bifunctional GTP diphosphokinase/guanosine-3',5'-bis pyrophosphate 3'-pyrophosphohydrolase [gamma proteobacterium symbiont of Bathyaustriella thionipta]MCU7954777.1 bifunctional GTP diphosphokinase/guanosine-3',5'-bis pyrophosphate 3'-pyrophosphohydrolase [gamma proteobacterium symbiont of Bathyaustriella thionipta]MCU7956551.1 bi
MLNTYLEEDKVSAVYHAYLFGAEAHEGQTRMTGEPYIYHPIAVARILAEMRMDEKTLIAAILHDVIEDTKTHKEQIATLFGQEVAEIVDGVTKLDHIQFDNKQEAKAESFRKMILAMVKDIRVILIKLADRLHNMRTLGIMRPEKARRIAAETLEVYAPIANRLGMNVLRHELEDLGFKAYYPMRYRVLKDSILKTRGNRKAIVEKIQDALKNRLNHEGIECQVLGREKHIYSIYQKMQSKQLPFSEVYDVYAFRLVVDSVDSCYRALGAVHALYKPIPGKFKDYIAIPKVNGYQSLHTILFSPFGVPIEVQLRTIDMHRVAENGIAAHWGYKEGENNGGVIAQAKAREWLKGLLDLQQNAGDSIEFLESVKVDLFPDEVYVFSPRGEIMELPRGATIVDFAYAVHTDIGNSCIAAKINQQHTPLSTQLKNGQTIEIITAPGATPNPSWLNFVFTAKARSNIRNILKNLHQDESVALGTRLLNKCLSNINMSVKDLTQSQIQRVVKDYSLKTFDELLNQIGLGNRIPQLVVRHLLPEQCKALDQSNKELGLPLDIRGTEGTVVHYGRCCHPIPGDDIVGYISSGRGIVIHAKSCKNAKDSQVQKWIDVEWSDDVSTDFSVALRVVVEHRKGVLATIASAISDSEANIEHVVTAEREDQLSSLDFILAVRNRRHLADIMRNLRALDMVATLTRL